MKIFRCIVTYFTFQMCCFESAKSDIFHQNQQLRKKLLQNYDKHALPHIDVNATTTVHFNVLTKRISLDDETQIFKLNAIIDLTWYDDRLKWDYKDYGGLKKVHFGDNEIWKPDIYVYNNDEASEIDHYANVHFLVFNDGRVFWVPPAIFKVPCSIDLRFWPFDTQECTIIVGSWTSNGWQLNLVFTKNDTEIASYEMMKDSDKWKIIKAFQKRHVAFFECCPEPYITLEFKYKIRRNSPHFCAFVVIPAVVIPILLMIQFILPVNHPKRLSIGLICSVLVLMELLFLKYSIPKIGSRVSLVVTYYSHCLILVVLTIFLSAILQRLTHPTHPLIDFPPPEIIKSIITGPLATILCISTHASKVMKNEQAAEDGEVLKESQNQRFSHEWLLISRVVDRICLILFTGIFIFSIIGYIAPIK